MTWQRELQRRRRDVCVLVCLMFHVTWSAISAGAATLVEAAPAEVGASKEKLDAAVALVRTAVDRDEVRGAVLLVARRGRIILHEPLGWRDVENQLPMERETLFHVASNTKPVVAAAALQLAEQGKLDLDAPIGRYLPAFDQDRYRGVTTRRLLSHTSGLRIPTIFLEPLAGASAERPDGPTLRSEVDRFATLGPEVPPGSSFSYNNPGYNIVGAVIEAVTGRPIDAVLSERFYQPLSMGDTSHVDRTESLPRRSRIYARKDDAWTIRYRPGDPPLYPFVRSSGGMLTTARDYAQFLQMFLNQGHFGEHLFLQPGTVAAATAPQTRGLLSLAERAKQGSFYGYGWQVQADGSYAHGGSDGTYAWVDPARELFGILFTQSPGGKIPREEFRRAVEQACATEPVSASRVVAHRGLLREFPENTLVNFRACLERRIGFELDVRRTRDGILVCLHDETLERTTNGTGAVRERSLADLKMLDAGSWFAPRFRDERLPTIDEVFELIGALNTAGAPIAVDLKGDDPEIERDVVSLARKHGILEQTVMIGRAINQPDVRRRLRAADEQTPVACLAGTADELDAAIADRDSNWAYLRFVPDARQVERIHQAGKKVFLAGPTVAGLERDNWQRAATSGVDAILTDYATELAQQL